LLLTLQKKNIAGSLKYCENEEQRKTGGFMSRYKLSLIICLFLTPFLISAGEYAGGVKAKVVLKTTTTGSGDPVAYLRTDQPEITAMKVDIAPGAETGWHTHPVPVYAYVLAGSLTVRIEGHKSLEFNEGDVIIEVMNTRHNGINTGAVPVRLIVFYTGAKTDLANVVGTTAP
jgi:quercetin dioxygenase-like cupin family protein